MSEILEHRLPVDLLEKASKAAANTVGARMIS
jgi:hypothetical protein